MHQRLTIAKFEISKKKVALKPSAIIGLLVVFLLFSGAFFLLSQFGYKPQHDYYSFSQTSLPIDAYIDASDTMRISSDGDVQVFLRSDGTYIIDANNRLEKLAATSAIIDELRKQNRQLILSSGIQPPFLIFLNISNRQREEIITNFSPQKITQTTNTNRTLVTNDNQEIILNPKQPAQIPSISDYIPPEGTQLVTQQRTIPSQPLNPIVPTTNLSRQNQQYAVPENYVLPEDVNTLVGVKYLFILIQLMLVFNFFSALFGNAFFEEKLNYRSSLLFSAPIRKRYVIIGKMLPYISISMVIATLLIFIQYPFLLFQPLMYILLPVIALTYFSLSFLNGLLARSNKEYSFLNVFTTSILSLYLLIPAFIANYSTLGYASLLTPVLLLAQKIPVPVSLVIFLGLIYAALAGVVFAMGSALWRFDHLYKYESPIKKILYIIYTNTHSAWRYFVFGVCCVPFLWLIQIVLIAIFVIVPLENKLFLLLLFAAISEELVRTLAARAHILNQINSPIPIQEPKQSWKQAFLVGLGFGLTEKIILFAAIAPYLDGYQFIITTGVLIPIILHTTFTYLFSTAMQKYTWCQKHANILCIALGTIHALFNYFIITIAGVKLI